MYMYAPTMTTVPCRALCAARMQLHPYHVLFSTSHLGEMRASVPISAMNNDERQSPDFCLSSGRSTLCNSSSSFSPQASITLVSSVRSP